MLLTTVCKQHVSMLAMLAWPKLADAPYALPLVVVSHFSTIVAYSKISHVAEALVP